MTASAADSADPAAGAAPCPAAGAAPFAAALRRAQRDRVPLVLDGAAGTQLEALGADLSGGLWSARLLAEDPALIAGLHAAYTAAGAQVIESVSYQASPQAAAGFTAPEARKLLARSWQLADAAASESDTVHRAAEGAAEFAGFGDACPGVWAAASIGPYGAYLADGSEYTGIYPVAAETRTGETTPATGAATPLATQLADFHRERVTILYDAGARLFAVETIPRLDETLAVAAVMAEFPTAEWWLSFSLAELLAG